MASSRIIMMRRFALAALAAHLVACGGSKPPVKVVKTPPPDVKVPDWVYETPSKPGYICATGAVDKTYYQQDGRVYAAEAARNELARTIQVTIYSVMYDYESNRGGSVRQYIVSEVESAVAGGVLNGAEIVHSWYDKYGNVANPGMTYALACMKKDQSVADLAEKIKEAYPEEEREAALEGVRQRAEKAFDELEAMEAKHAEKKSGTADVPPPAANPEETMEQ
ncbi:MAG: LPP20 family lipoprotein [Deltaproteobacteria bacterium]